MTVEGMTREEAYREGYRDGKEAGRREAVEEMKAVIEAWSADIRLDLRGIETRLEDIEDKK